MTTSTFVAGRRRFARHALLYVSTILCSGLGAPAFAQLSAPAPVRQSSDTNGVDLFAGTLSVDAPGISMGQGDQGLNYHQLTRGGAGWSDSVTAAINQSGSTVSVSLGGTTDQFNASGTTYTATQGNGATLVLGSGIYTYTRADGMVVHFASSKSSPAPYYANLGRVTDIQLPSGSRLVFAYDSIQYCNSNRYAGEPDVCTGHATAFHLTSVTSSYGYRLTFVYGQFDAANYDPNEVDNSAAVEAYSTATGVTETNVAQNGSSGQTISFGFTNGGINGTYTITDPLGRVTSYRMSAGQVAGITRPGSGSEDMTIAYSGGRVSSVTTAVGTWNYASSDANGTRTVTVTDPVSHTTTYMFDIASTLMTQLTDALGNVSTWSYTSDGTGHVHLATAPEQGSVEYGYDARGNVTSATLHAKPGAGLGDITTSAAYPPACDNAVTCNQPTSTIDARGNRTDYSYDPTHGGVVTVTAPAPSSGAVQPQTRYGYTSFTDYLGGTVYRQTSSSTCRTQASCAGTSDEVVSTISYGSVSANNLLPMSMSKGAGDGSLTATNGASYDAIGNMVRATDPLGNVTAYRYDADREVVGVVGPDPDGSGSGNWNPAARFTYDGKGNVTLAEQGTAPGQSDSDWNSFSSHHQVATTYDTMGRKVQETTRGSGVTSSLLQYSYNGLGWLDCTALRMNPDAYGSSLPGACDLGSQGSFGADRIGRNEYDALGRVTKIWNGYRTDAASASQASYTADGKTQTVTDENGNVTTYVYDGFDRLSQTHYPNGSGGGSSASDYEQTEYDQAGNLTRRWLRGTGNHQDYVYDALNRPTTLSVPGLNASDHGATYAYDNLGELTSANEDNNMFATFGYDALGRRVSEGSRAGGTKTFGYDLAGRRTRVTWQDGFYVTYEYDHVGHMTVAYDNTGSQLFYLSYNDDGQRTSLCPNGTMGNQAMCTQYGYDAAARLNAQNLLGNDSASVTIGGYNPAGQIGQRQNVNDAYAWRGATNANAGYTVNGLNQYTAVSGAGLGYDLHGNLTNANGHTYSYDSFNRLGEYDGGSNAGNWLYYDAIGRLNWSNASQTRFDYDGTQLISELDANGNISRRYVYGPSPDEPVVWYEGPGTSDKRFLASDERGSVVRVQRNDGSTIAINSYDEYGNPASGNQGRFGYTGQTWLPELGLWYYKARMYSPRLGRFMQTDPIGYNDGLNWYNYVGGDPINRADSYGLGRDGTTNQNVKPVNPNETPPDITVTANPLPSNQPSPYASPTNITITGPQAPNADNQAPQPSDIVVTAKPQKGNAIVVTAKKAAQCALDHFGLTGLGSGLAAAGANLLNTRGKFGGATPGTSVASKLAGDLLGDLKLPTRLPTLTGFPAIGNGLRVSFTESAARFAGRAVPVVGYALLAYDVYEIGKCTVSGSE